MLDLSSIIQSNPSVQLVAFAGFYSIIIKRIIKYTYLIYPCIKRLKMSFLWAIL
jgi:hypothetical protein